MITNTVYYVIHRLVWKNLSQTSQWEVIQADLDERIKELDSSVDLHRKALRKARKEPSTKSQKRKELNIELGRDIKSYESVFLSNVRFYDKTIATLQERLKGFELLKKMLEEIEILDKEVVTLTIKETVLKQQIEKEKSSWIVAKFS